ncbi:hypothetical protein [Paenibacillus crassostreae]|uniref:hypothetical protein n=1 Tax=Paenibacillus crassostreae TaxID=1763538 RepID=UPI000B0F8859|nr:hypothetical protein [Paenibacillus crassostreae]
MVEDAEKLKQVLHKYHYPVNVYVAPKENHASVVPTIMSRMFRFGCSQLQVSI